MGNAVRAAVARTPGLEEWLDPAFIKQRAWSPWLLALKHVHRPQSLQDLSPHQKERERLAYDELLANQLALVLMREHLKQQGGRSIRGTGNLVQQAIDALPYDLTKAQSTALGEIDQDMASPLRMTRLLQGDVGSGKTVVAFLAMLRAVEADAQAALMAPTEILARQHYAFIRPLAESLDIPVTILTGRDKGEHRQQILTEVASAQIKILIGTHALFQDGVDFHDLAVAVIDEQHRFGVHQRLRLTGKGGATDMLVMTATPIPRTLMLTIYGDMDVSRLTEKPPGRQPIKTRVMPLGRLGDVIDALRRAVEGDDRVYWVCPLIEESELVDATAAQERYEALRAIFDSDVGLMHGRMTPQEKDDAMFKFRAGDFKILVATTVIEVGVDVPEANIIVIEQAERFGLAQLHQLRGRVGRGQSEASCLLLYESPLSKTAQTRLEIMRETEDGFRIAEEDLRLRGAGELLGIKQSGLPQLRLADLELHSKLLTTARNDANLIVSTDPHLESPRGKALRVLLYLFGRDEAVRYLRSG
jgi:ATP-dependent DNA helicase RecG